MNKLNKQSGLGVTAVSLGVVFIGLIAVAIAVTGYIFSGRSKITVALSAIQNNLTELTLLKIDAGSFPVSSKLSVAWENTASSVKSVSDTLSIISAYEILKDYRLASIAWSKDILGSVNNTNWKKINNQPYDFRLILNDEEASEFLKSSVNKIAELKALGDEAIKAKDMKAMLKIAASLLVQKHWLNGILHSSTNPLSINIITTVFAQGKLPGIPEVGPGCAIETDRSKANYGECKIPGTIQTPTPTEKTKQVPVVTPTEKIKLTPEETENKKNDQLPNKKSGVYEPYTYASNIRKVCFTAYNGKNFCVPEVIEAATDIYNSAINYVNGKVSGSYDWEKVWKSATDIAGIEPSIPSVEGGHEIPSDGAITTGEKDLPSPSIPKINTGTPTPITNLPKTTKDNSWDGGYVNEKGGYTWSNIYCVGNTGSENKQSKGGFPLSSVRNNMVYAGFGKEKAIDSNGFVSYEIADNKEYSSITTWQFYKKDGVIYADGKDVEHYVGIGVYSGKVEERTCTRTVTVHKL